MSHDHIKIIHISDPHFGTTSSEKIRSLTEAIYNLQPDMVLVSGDITQRARRQQFLQAREFYDQLSPFSVISVPGNHDIPLFNLFARFFDPYHGYRKILGAELHEQKRLRWLEVVALNSTHPSRHVNGALSLAEQSRLLGFSTESKFRIALLHHPLDCAEQADEKNLLLHAESIMHHLEGNKVDLVLTGHIHDPLVRLSHHRYPNSLRPCILTVAGTCLSSRTRPGAPNSFHYLQASLSKDQDFDLHITRYDLSTKMRFEPIFESNYIRRGRETWISKPKENH